jgi:hypothetical protein
MSKKGLKTVRCLRLNRDIRILLADRVSCIVFLEESEYNDKLNTLLQSGVYEPFPKDPAAKIEKYRNSFPNTKLPFWPI